MSTDIPAAVREQMARWASLGGHARAKKLSKKRQREIAEKASRAAKRARDKRRAKS